MCRAVGYAVKADGSVNVYNALRTQAVDEAATAPISDIRGQPPKLVSESGVYKLVLRFGKPERLGA